MTIDFHTHVPTDRRRWPEFIEDCRRNGVDIVAVSSLGTTGWPAFPTAEQVRAANDQAREFAEFARNLLKILWFVYVNPCLPDSREEAKRGLDKGASGIKLWISLKDDTGCTRVCEPILELAEKRGCPVLIHTFHRTGGNQPGEITIDEFADLARLFPSVPMIAAHAGANWRLTLGNALDGLPNAYVDVCGTFPEAGMVDTLVRDLGTDRVVFGSDMIGRSQASQLAKVELAALTPEERAAVLWGNAHRLLGLDNEAPSPPSNPSVQSRHTPPFPGALPDPREDHFCFCGNWPFAPDLSKTLAQFHAALDTADIDRAYAASLDAACAGDPRPANRAFAAECRGSRPVLPLAVLNPAVPNWRRALCEVRNDFRGVWVSPYLHNWPLDAPEHALFFQECARSGVPLWINRVFGDHRFRPTGVNWRPVLLDELCRFAQSAPANTYVFQGLLANEILRVQAASRPARTDFRFEISRLTDRTGDLAAVLGAVGRESLVFGAEYPLRDIREVRWAARRLPVSPCELGDDAL